MGSGPAPAEHPGMTTVEEPIFLSELIRLGWSYPSAISASAPAAPVLAPAKAWWSKAMLLITA
jgi:hypothetical protein